MCAAAVHGQQGEAAEAQAGFDPVSALKQTKNSPKMGPLKGLPKKIVNKYFAKKSPFKEGDGWKKFLDPEQTDHGLLALAGFLGLLVFGAAAVLFFGLGLGVWFGSRKE